MKNSLLTHSLLTSFVALSGPVCCANPATPVVVPTALSRQSRIVAFTNWPPGTSPTEIGERVTKRFIATPHPNFGSSKPPADITYPEVCAWYGALTFANVSDNKELCAQLSKRFAPLFAEEADLVPTPNHVDATVFGSVPLELYLQTKEHKYLSMGQHIADMQWEPPKADNVKGKEYYARGLSKQTRLWIDDMYMITAVQSQAYRATGNPIYIERAAREMVIYLDELQRPNGLFYHAPDVPFFWGRGNGWMAAGMTELLSSLPTDNPHRPYILKCYQEMMASLLSHQMKNGMWCQLVDDPQSWPETSSTGMFTFAMITGVTKGWLEAKTYAPAARKSWLALISYLDTDANVAEVCEGTNKKNDRRYYLDRKRIKGDMHGQAPILWSATALLRALKQPY